MHPFEREELPRITDSPLAYHPPSYHIPGYPANPRMLLARLYLQLGVFLDYYTAEHKPSLSSTLRPLLGGDVDTLRQAVPEECKSLFPQLSVDKGWPPTMLLHGTNDTAVPVEESRNLRSMLENLGVAVQLTEFEGKEHSFDYEPGAEDIWKVHFDNLYAFLLALQTVSALPYDRRAGTDNGIAEIAHDTRENVFYMYRRDGTLYGRFDEENFKQILTLHFCQLVPGWGKIEQYAKDTYGDGGVNIVVNPSEYPNYPATICAANEVVQVKLKGAPSCQESKQSMEGKVDNGDGIATVKAVQGYSNTGSWTVTQTSSFAQSIGFSLQIGIPTVGEASVSSTTTVTIENSLASSFSTTVNHEIAQEFTMNSPDGRQCEASLSTKACSLSGEGKVRFVAQGWIWFNYEDKRSPKTKPDKNNEHYKCENHPLFHFYFLCRIHWTTGAVNIQNAVKNLDERSSFLSFAGSMQTSSNSVYKGNCVNAPALKGKAQINTALKGTPKPPNKKAVKAPAKPSVKAPSKPSGKGPVPKAPAKVPAKPIRKGPAKAPARPAPKGPAKPPACTKRPCKTSRQTRGPAKSPA
ncbi:hypothetical protein NLJ89_g7696 [Agrocybe chaxingu]|uniref:Peptidase S9 prolyl oligopeptidase catalytic domain-containing protein n=1 Tax=Agrocybe chaxingu TaxID=84603 RepID=A0A9W8K3W7_9AGAR|nr:hypothetical protein NLJ89_g7696 [Agrocybe chaxingu]